MVPWQEPWAGDIYSGSWKSIGPARIQIKGSVTHQPYKGKQIFSLVQMHFMDLRAGRKTNHLLKGAWHRGGQGTGSCSCSTAPSQAQES